MYILFMYSFMRLYHYTGNYCVCIRVAVHVFTCVFRYIYVSSLCSRMVVIVLFGCGHLPSPELCCLWLAILDSISHV